ncbi:MAG: DUF697 domain-containing protein [Anaerolineae bacterium]|nr:DUF697 domain-containing protein [Anaerolineae bacterium]
MTSQEKKADNVILGAVVSTAAMGALPLLGDITTLVVANGAMIGGLALIYDMEWDDNQTRKFVQRVIESSAVTLGSLKLLATGLALTGIGLPLAITMNGVLNAMITLGLGRAAKFYFASGGEAKDSEVYEKFMKTVGLSGLKDVVKMVRDEAKKVVESDKDEVEETEATEEEG